MTVFGALGFSAPWLLVGLIALPVLWFLLRAVPPAPIRRKFPAVSLLLGLQDDEHQSDKTPWWLLLLRMLAVAAVIIGLAGPVLNPDARQSGRGPILVVLDASWASATDWRARVARLEPMLAEAGRNGRPVAILPLTASAPVTFADADAVIEGLPGLAPAPWEPRFDVTLPDGDFDTWWLSDGLDYDGRDALAAALSERGNLTVFDTATTPTVLMPPVADGAELTLSAMRLTVGPSQEFTISALGPDPSGVERILGTGAITFEAGEAEASTTIELPSEIRARVSRFSLDGVRSAGAVTLTDDRLQRREVALINGGRDREALDLLSPLHYLRQALEPTADLLDGGLEDILLANPDTIILADVARLAPQEEAELLEWIDGGGQLVRFAGPRLAASDVSRDTEDPLLPVRLRAGGRSVGGAMSWGDPKTLAPFPEDSPFAGLPLPDDVDVTSQVVAQPDPTLTDRVIASLSDGTPLVTRKAHGAGQIVLFHVTANAEWST
ncbi:MAG: BatA domain-containing protein, partial [Donghicola eburneus]